MIILLKDLDWDWRRLPDSEIIRVLVYPNDPEPSGDPDDYEYQQALYEGN